MSQPKDLTEAIRIIAEKDRELEKVQRELDETKNDVINIGAKFLPILEFTGLFQLYKQYNGAQKPSTIKIIITLGKNLASHWEQVNLIMKKDGHIFAQLIDLFMAKYGKEVQKRRSENVMMVNNALAARKQQELGGGSYNQTKQLGNGK